MFALLNVCHSLIKLFLCLQSFIRTFSLLAALTYLMNHTDENINTLEFEKSSGVGVTVTPEEIERVVEKIVSANKNELIEKRYSFNIGTLMGR